MYSFVLYLSWNSGCKRVQQLPGIRAGFSAKKTFLTSDVSDYVEKHAEFYECSKMLGEEEINSSPET